MLDDEAVLLHNEITPTRRGAEKLQRQKRLFENLKGMSKKKPCQ